MRCSRTTRRIAFLAIFLGLWFSAQAADLDALRGDQVGWARLQTSSPHWRGHGSTDPKLMQYLRDHTTLNLDATWYAASVDDLEEMKLYPLLFSQGIQTVTRASSQKNLAEYLQRGGFLLVDACINPFLRGEPAVFLAGQRNVLAQALPEARVALIPNDHPLYTCLFEFVSGPPHTEDGFGWGTPGLYGIYLGPRLIGVISLSGLQCGWAGMKRSAAHEVRCMQMLVNIYVYAMLKAG